MTKIITGFTHLLHHLEEVHILPAYVGGNPEERYKTIVNYARNPIGGIRGSNSIFTAKISNYSVVIIRKNNSVLVMGDEYFKYSDDHDNTTDGSIDLLFHKMKNKDLLFSLVAAGKIDKVMQVCNDLLVVKNKLNSLIERLNKG